MTMLEEIFAEQRRLMDAIAPVEAANGYPPLPPLPLQLNTRQEQDILRSFAWYYTEEVLEAVNAPTHHSYVEELSDCLHFMVEICILVGVTPKDVTPFSQPHIKDTLDPLGLAMNLLKGKPWKKQFSPPPLPQFQSHIARALSKLIQVIQGAGCDPHELYFKKNLTNHQRMQGDY